MATGRVSFGRRRTGNTLFKIAILVLVAIPVIFLIIRTRRHSGESPSELRLPGIGKGMTLDGGPTDEGITGFNRIIVNVISAETESTKNGQNPIRLGQAREYQINGESFQVGEVEPMATYFKKRKTEIEGAAAGKNSCFIVIRSDWRVDYKAVEVVLMAAVEANIPKMNIAIISNSGIGRQQEGVIPGMLPELGGAAGQSQNWKSDVIAVPAKVEIMLRSTGKNREGCVYELIGVSGTTDDPEQLYKWLVERVEALGGEGAIGEVQVQIQPAPNVRWGFVVKAFDAATRAKFKKVGFAPAQ